MPRKKKAEVVQTVDQVAVIYARYSSHAQKEESIEQQVEECTAFAAPPAPSIITSTAQIFLSVYIRLIQISLVCSVKGNAFCTLLGICRLC